jgi:hypothetical protein
VKHVLLTQRTAAMDSAEWRAGNRAIQVREASPMNDIGAYQEDLIERIQRPWHKTRTIG